ncbi:MAG: hypothetical protein RLZZ435_209 [Cyanobacteriota bacterium]|jgi:hypothetical protein
MAGQYRQRLKTPPVNGDLHRESTTVKLFHTNHNTQETLIDNLVLISELIVSQGKAKYYTSSEIPS